jgi:hypothetical protein
MDAMKKRLLISLTLLSLIYLLSGCGASYHIKRARKLAPEYFTTNIDTVRDTIFIEVASVDTVFNYQFDTVEMWLDKTYVKYNYDTITNDVFIEVDCPDDSVVVETITEVREVPYIVEPTKWDILKLLFSYWWVFVLLGIALGWKIIRGLIRAYLGF